MFDPQTNKIIVESTRKSSSPKEGFPLDHPTMLAIQQLLANRQIKEQGSIDLATGFDLFRQREPCTMCAMALYWNVSGGGGGCKGKEGGERDENCVRYSNVRLNRR